MDLVPDPDPTFHFDTDLDPILTVMRIDPAPYQSDANMRLLVYKPSPAPCVARVRASPWLRFEPPQLLNFDFDEDPHPAFDFDAVPILIITLIRIRISMRIRNTAINWCKYT